LCFQYGEEVGIKNEQVDDIPLLLEQMERMGIVVDGSHMGRLVIVTFSTQLWLAMIMVTGTLYFSS